MNGSQCLLLKAAPSRPSRFCQWPPSQASGLTQTATPFLQCSQVLDLNSFVSPLVVAKFFPISTVDDSSFGLVVGLTPVIQHYVNCIRKCLTSLIYICLVYVFHSLIFSLSTFASSLSLLQTTYFFTQLGSLGLLIS